MASETRIDGGIEWFVIPSRVEGGVSIDAEEDCQCARCGSSCAFVRCWNCDEYGYSHHSCGEDCCFCVDPQPNVRCDWCRGKGGSWHCISTPAWCKANPLPGRESIESTALNAAAWSDAHD